MNDTFASYVEAIEATDLPGTLRQVEVPTLLEGGQLHLRRSSGIRLCDWRLGGKDAEHVVEALLERDDLCRTCFPGALALGMNMNSVGEAGVLVLTHLGLQLVRTAGATRTRLERGQAVSTTKVYEQLHGLRRLLGEARSARFWAGAQTVLLEALEERMQGALEGLTGAVRSETQRARVLHKVQRAEAAIRSGWFTQYEPDTQVLLSYSSDVTGSLNRLPMLASEVVATFTLDKPVTALVAPGLVANYLRRVAVRGSEWRLRSFEVSEAPTDPQLRETALGLWDPTGQGPLRHFPEAVRAAQLL